MRRGNRDSHLTLPSAWKERLGALKQIRTVEIMTATQEVIEGAICGPIRVEIEGFPPVFGEVLFVDMEPQDGRYEPLIGYRRVQWNTSSSGG